MRDLQKEIAEDYQEFFNFLNKEHNLILTKSEMDELVFEAQKLVKKLSLGVVSNNEVAVCVHPYAFLRGEEHGNAECLKCGKKLE